MAIKPEDKDQIEKDGEARRAKAESKAKVAEGTIPQQLSKQSRVVDSFIAYASGAAKVLKELRSKVINAENRAKTLALENLEAEKNLAKIERKSNLELQKSSQGIRALADRLAVSEGKLYDREQKCKNLETKTNRQAQELEELKAHYQTKLESLEKYAKANSKSLESIPGN